MLSLAQSPAGPTILSPSLQAAEGLILLAPQAASLTCELQWAEAGICHLPTKPFLSSDLTRLQRSRWSSRRMVRWQEAFSIRALHMGSEVWCGHLQMHRFVQRHTWNEHPPPTTIQERRYVKSTVNYGKFSFVEQVVFMKFCNSWPSSIQFRSEEHSFTTCSD